MGLPNYEQILFRKSPLKLVVGQVRFPLVPRFDRSLFQSFLETLRDEYPRPSREQQAAVQGSPTDVEQRPGEELWRFTTRDRFWSVVVGESAVTLEARAYSSISDFLSRFKRVLQVARDQLDVRERTRLGLRYTNELRNREAQTLNDWSGLLRQDLVGFAAAGVLDGRIEHMLQEVQVERPDGTVAIRHGLLKGTTVVPLPDEQPVGGPFYLIDLDYYDVSECDLDIEATVEQMRMFNDVLYRFFRWTLSEQLAAKLEPVDVSRPADDAWDEVVTTARTQVDRSGHHPTGLTGSVARRFGDGESSRHSTGVDVTAGWPARPDPSDSKPAERLREKSGLDASRLAAVFGVSRVAYQNWIAGVAPHGARREHLLEVLAFVEEAERRFAGAREVGDWLLTPTEANGRRPIDLLATREYDTFRGFLLRVPTGRERVRPMQMAPRARRRLTGVAFDDALARLHPKAAREDLERVGEDTGAAHDG